MTTTRKPTSLKIFLFKLLAFLVLIFCVDKLIGMQLKKFYFKQTSGLDYLTTYALEKTTADILILGSSRAVNIFNTAEFEKKTGLTCYNGGRYGEPIFYHLALLKSALARYNPKVILLSFDAGNFSENSQAYDRLTVLLPYYNSHPEIRSIVDLKGPYEKLKLVSSIYPYNSLLLPIITGNTAYSKQKYANTNGYIPIDKTIQGPLKTFDYTKDTVLDSVKINSYKSFIESCLHANIPLFIVCPPYMIRPIGTDPSITAGKAIAGEYHIPFLDYSRDSFYTSKPQLFADFRHLNADGVSYFAKAVLDTVTTYRFIK
jgi:hypothetical protein